jgi:hypothetical protein
LSETLKEFTSVISTPAASTECTNAPHPAGAWDKHAVAELTIDAISQMDFHELVRAIIASDLALIGEGQASNLQHLDRTTLERLTHLARRCCRNQGY